MKDRRQHTRWQLNQQAMIKLEGALRFTPCLVKDINFNGAQIALRMRLPEDSFLKFSLVLSDECVLDIEAWVAWHKRRDIFNLYGLYFTKIKGEDKEKIYKFIYKLLPEEAVKVRRQETAINKGDEAMQDRRIFARFPANLPLKFIDLGANQQGRAQTVDMCAKGLGLVTDKEFSLGAALEMWLDIPGQHEPLYARGEVAWSKRLEPDKCRVGIELERADLMSMGRILRPFPTS